MTQEDKQLLLKDLCARFPYKVICELSGDGGKITEQLQLGGLGQFLYGRIEVKPYLRPMSSMTEEEYNEWFNTYNTAERLELERNEYKEYISATIVGDMAKYDWLNKKMFDYRGLIPMGLALEAPKDMYKIK